MASFSEESLAAKLKSMDESQASIVGLSQWILFHHRQSDRIAKTWNTIIGQTEPNKRLPLIYLLNDVLQSARARKKFNVLKSFDQYLYATLSNTYHELKDEATKKRMQRIVNVLTERKVLPDELLTKLNSVFYDNLKDTPTVATSSVTEGKIDTPTPPFSEAVLPEFKVVTQNNSKINKAEAAITASLEKFNKEYDELFPGEEDGSNNVESPITFLAELEKILTTYNNGVKKNLDYIIDKRNNTIEQLQQLINLEKKQIQTASDSNQVGKKYNILDKYNKIIQTKRELESLLLGTSNTEVSENNNESMPDTSECTQDQEPITIPNNIVENLCSHNNEAVTFNDIQNGISEKVDVAQVNVDDNDVPQYDDSSDEDVPQYENSSDDEADISKTNKKHKNEESDDIENQREIKKPKIEAKPKEEFSQMKTSELLRILDMVTV